jgi:hypothetical protein
MWESLNKAAETYGNGLISGDPVPPEYFLTQQAVIGDTYVFNATTILDFRASYMRWYNDRTPGTLGIDLTSVGFPNSYKNSLPSDRVTMPTFILDNYNQVNTGSISARTNNYVISTNLTKIKGSHTLKFGADLRRLEDNYWQNNNPGGTFNFSNLFTSANALNRATGDSFHRSCWARRRLAARDGHLHSQQLYYQGYFTSTTPGRSARS